MKNSAPKLLKQQSLALVLSLLSACGTEIGNGRKPPAVPEATPDDSNHPTTEESGGNSPTDTTTTPNEPAPDTTLDYLLIACGSPIPDMTVATFVDQISQTTLTVTLPAADTWNLVMTSPAHNITVTKNATMAQPYAIASTSTLGTQTCATTTNVLNGSITERSILYSDNFKTTWTIDGNSHVTEIKVEDGSGMVIRDWLAQ